MSTVLQQDFLKFPVPQQSCQNGDHTDFAQEERLGLPYWTMIWASCVVLDESKCLDIRILEFLAICEHLPSGPWSEQLKYKLLFLHVLEVCDMMFLTIVAVS